MMLYDFIALDEIEHTEAVWSGVHIADREDQEQKRIIFYQIDSFYVEVYYHKELNVIKRFRPFSSTDQLEPYLNQIDIVGKLNR